MASGPPLLALSLVTPPIHSPWEPLPVKCQPVYQIISFYCLIVKDFPALFGVPAVFGFVLQDYIFDLFDWKVKLRLEGILDKVTVCSGL